MTWYHANCLVATAPALSVSSGYPSGHSTAMVVATYCRKSTSCTVPTTSGATRSRWLRRTRMVGGGTYSLVHGVHAAACFQAWPCERVPGALAAVAGAATRLKTNRLAITAARPDADWGRRITRNGSAPRA